MGRGKGGDTSSCDSSSLTNATGNFSSNEKENIFWPAGGSRIKLRLSVESASILVFSSSSLSYPIQGGTAASVANKEPVIQGVVLSMKLSRHSSLLFLRPRPPALCRAAAEDPVIAPDPKACTPARLHAGMRVRAKHAPLDCEPCSARPGHDRGFQLGTACTPPGRARARARTYLVRYHAYC